MFIPAISSFQSTFTTNLPVNIPRHVIVPSFILSAPAYRTHSPHWLPFLPYFRTFCRKGILLCQYEISYNLFSQIFTRVYITGPQYMLLNLLLQSNAKFYPTQYLPFLSHTAHTLFSASIHSPSSFTLYSFGSIASEMLTTLLSPTFLSNAYSLFLTYQLSLFSSLLMQLPQLIRPLPPFFLGTYILTTSLLGCSFLFIVTIFLDFLFPEVPPHSI